jgi:hypothetical protein
MGNNSDAAQAKRSLTTCSTALVNEGKKWMTLVLKGRRREPALPLNVQQGTPQRLQQQRLVHTRFGDILMMFLHDGKHDKQLYQEILYGHSVNNDRDVPVPAASLTTPSEPSGTLYLTSNNKQTQHSLSKTIESLPVFPR